VLTDGDANFSLLLKGTCNATVMPLYTVCGDNEAFDLERRENNGIPYDVGWGPYCIESGWTVGKS
jgi:hypothetical protein